jgi:hypothetical protein
MENQMDRRGFVSGVAAGAVAAAGVAGMVAQGSAASAQEQDSAAEFDRTCDVVVVGSGMGGMCAGVEALKDGAKDVIIVEISKWTGGGTSFAYGAVHGGSAGKTIETFDQFTEYTNTSDLAHKVYENFEPLLHWIQDDLQLPIDVNYDIDTPFGRMLNADGEGNPSSTRYFMDQFAALFESLGGTILTQTRATRILMDDDRTRATGIQCLDADGNVLKIGASAVILSCGGWQNNTELKARYLGMDGNYARCMGTPYNTGAGLMMAQEAGASLQGSMRQWAGCFLAASPAKNPMEDPVSYEEYDYNADTYGKWWLYNTVIDQMDGRNIWVNCDGKRFVDENLPGLNSKHAVASQRHATAILICDSTVWEEWMATPAVSYIDTVGDQFDIITSDAIGGKVFSADTIEELADKLNETGVATYMVNKANLVATIDEYNAAAEAGDGEAIFPPRSDAQNFVALSTPPFYAFPMQAAPYANYGGVAIDENAQVLDLSRKPIPGLYATVPCAGGVLNEFYTGTIAAAGITGRIAGSSAAGTL